MIGATALATVAVTNIQAQETESATIDQIVVTGSRITRDGYEAPTPVSVLGAEELNALNTVNVADAVNVLPAFSNSASPRSANGNLSTGATGVSQLNLRGMGTNRTLVLLDGKRYINAALTSGNSAPDINSFPNALIERVDVVTGGASAAYGSDALSGVVNFVIDHDFTGFKGEVQTGMTKYEDDKSISAQLSYGTPFADGRGHFLASGEYTQSDGIDGTNDRPWANCPRPSFSIRLTVRAGKSTVSAVRRSPRCRSCRRYAGRHHHERATQRNLFRAEREILSRLRLRHPRRQQLSRRRRLAVLAHRRRPRHRGQCRAHGRLPAHQLST